MPVLTVNGIRINYYDDAPPAGAQNAPAVLLVMGSGGSGRAWHLHQVPALVAAGFRVISFDNRGIAPSEECPGGFGIDDLVA
ncbi:alpha/beta fold hydrolase, partial [Streptomyces violaceoruber]